MIFGCYRAGYAVGWNNSYFDHPYFCCGDGIFPAGWPGHFSDLESVACVHTGCHCDADIRHQVCVLLPAAGCSLRHGCLLDPDQGESPFCCVVGSFYYRGDPLCDLADLSVDLGSFLCGLLYPHLDRGHLRGDRAGPLDTRKDPLHDPVYLLYDCAYSRCWSVHDTRVNSSDIVPGAPPGRHASKHKVPLVLLNCQAFIVV